jgi:hypothetical protein
MAGFIVEADRIVGRDFRVQFKLCVLGGVAGESVGNDAVAPEPGFSLTESSLPREGCCVSLRAASSFLAVTSYRTP